MSGINRTQFIHIDCPSCKGKGFTQNGLEETPCERCGQSGFLEKEIPYRFETNGHIGAEELPLLFEIDPSEIPKEKTDRAITAEGE